MTEEDLKSMTDHPRHVEDIEDLEQDRGLDPCPDLLQIQERETEILEEKRIPESMNGRLICLHHHQLKQARLLTPLTPLDILPEL